jgi:pimeloyl-ACP methyl ester carboxylesterase
MPRKNHSDSRSLFTNEAKKLYQKEFIRWYSMVSQVNPLLSLFRMKDLGIPTIYLMGEQDYMFLPSISKLVENHKSSHLIIIPNCGHVVNVDQPLEFNQKALSFLKRI